MVVGDFDAGEVRALLAERFGAWRSARPFARLAPGSALPVGLLIARDGRSAYVASTMGDRVEQYDVATLAPLRSIPVAGEPDGLAATHVVPRAICHACVAEPTRP